MSKDLYFFSKNAQILKKNYGVLQSVEGGGPKTAVFGPPPSLKLNRFNGLAQHD